MAGVWFTPAIPAIRLPDLLVAGIRVGDDRLPLTARNVALELLAALPKSKVAISVEADSGLVLNHVELVLLGRALKVPDALPVDRAGVDVASHTLSFRPTL